MSARPWHVLLCRCLLAVAVDCCLQSKPAVPLPRLCVRRIDFAMCPPHPTPLLSVPRAPDDLLIRCPKLGAMPPFAYP